MVGLEEIPAPYGYEITEAAIYIQRTGEQPCLSEDFTLSDDDLDQLGLQILAGGQAGDG
jgi:hypothetical protein